MKSGRQEKIGAFLWILCAQFFVAEQLTSHAWRLPYSFARNYISDLGALHSPWHEIMNASFVVQGLLIGAGALSQWARFQKIGRLALSFLVMSAVGVILVGLAPSDANPSVHTLGAATHFLAAGLGIGLIGATKLREGKGYLSLFTGIVILTATASLGQIHDYSGTMERLGAYSIVLWLIASGAQAYK